MANFYRIGAAGLNWKNTGSWSSTSGGASNGVDEPSSSDAVFFDTNSPTSVTVSAAAVGASCSLTKSGLTITLNGGSVTISGTTTIATNAQVINKTAAETWSSSGFTANTSITGTAKIILTGGTWSGSNTTGISNDLDLQGNVTISGNVYYKTGTLRYVSGTNTVTSSTLNITGSCTLNLNGTALNNLTSTTLGYVITLTSNLLLNGTLTGNPTINKTVSETATVNGLTVSGGSITGTAKIIIISGTWSGNQSITNNFDINGNITVSGSVRYGTGTLTHVSGTVTTTGSTLQIAASCTLNTSGISWNNFSSIVGTPTVTLTSNLNINGLFTETVDTTYNKTTSEIINANGGITVNAVVQGTADIYLNGGTWSGSGANPTFNSNLYLNGNVTISGTVLYRTGTLTYVSGVLTVTGSTLSLTAGCTLVGGTYNNITLSNSAGLTYTINTTVVTINGTLTIGTGGTTTFAGTAGWNCATLSCAGTSAITVNLKESITYTITTSFSCYESRLGSIVLFTSSHASTKANILMPNNGNNSCNVLASFTRIDASGGRSICTFGGTITDCLNVVSYTDYNNSGSAFIGGT